MTDGTNTADTAAQAPAVDETLLQELGEGLEHLAAETAAAIVAAVKTFEVKYWPYIKAMLVTLATQEGKDALNAAISAAPSGNPQVIAAAAAAAVAGTLMANVEADAKAALAQEQSDAAAAAEKTAAETQAPADEVKAADEGQATS